LKTSTNTYSCIGEGDEEGDEGEEGNEGEEGEVGVVESQTFDQPCTLATSPLGVGAAILPTPSSSSTTAVIPVKTIVRRQSKFDVIAGKMVLQRGSRFMSQSVGDALETYQKMRSDVLWSHKSKDNFSTHSAAKALFEVEEGTPAEPARESLKFLDMSYRYPVEPAWAVSRSVNLFAFLTTEGRSLWERGCGYQPHPNERKVGIPQGFESVPENALRIEWFEYVRGLFKSFPSSVAKTLEEVCAPSFSFCSCAHASLLCGLASSLFLCARVHLFSLCSCAHASLLCVLAWARLLSLCSCTHASLFASSLFLRAR
jgi:hypothetical protein